MRFDKTFIAIRERNALELLDLTLHVIRYHFRPLAILLLIGALPWLLIDVAATYWMVSGDNYLDYIHIFYWVMALLVVSQAQVGTTFLTYYLGQAMFVGRPSARESLNGVFKTSLFYWWLQLGIRMVVPILACCFLLSSHGQDLNSFLFGFSMPVFLVIALIVRMTRPFVSEMLLLERTPVRSVKGKTINFSTRSKSLHLSASADAMSRFFLAAIISVPLAFVFYSALVWCDGVLNLQANADRNWNFVYWPIALWLTAGLISVFRFLNYIDTRIRQEGWAVELRMRAEALKLAPAN